MVIGIMAGLGAIGGRALGVGLVGLGLALPTGLAFGYGYGYGVRQGYSAFRPPGKTAQRLKASPNPIEGSLGMGLQTAEERTNRLGLGRPSLQSQEPAISDTISRQASSNEETRSRQRLDALRSGALRAPKYEPRTYRKRYR